MRIVMFTNLYLPKLGGVSISVERFAQAYRQSGHDVLIVAPDFPNQERDRPGVERVSALQHFNGTDFSAALPPGPDLSRRLDDFGPEIIHSHHPFLLGDSAARAAAHRGLPLVYTHHTMYEYYTHYVPLDSKVLRNYVVELSTRYADFCDLVFAPSQSVAEILRERGEEVAIEVVPTGVVLEEYGEGDRKRGRRAAGIDEDAFVIGHVGRLAEEKNLGFLTKAVIRAMKGINGSRFLVAGSGDIRENMQAAMAAEGLEDRIIFVGTRTGRDLADTYAAMDVFAFSSKSETQGMVLVEALAAGSPLVALDAPGAREVVHDGENGRLIASEEAETFAEGIRWIADLPADRIAALRADARTSAEEYSLDRCVDKALSAYQRVLKERRSTRDMEDSGWDRFLESIGREWKIWSHRAGALGSAIISEQDPAQDAG